MLIRQKNSRHGGGHLYDAAKVGGVNCVGVVRPWKAAVAIGIVIAMALSRRPFVTGESASQAHRGLRERPLPGRHDRLLSTRSRRSDEIYNGPFQSQHQSIVNDVLNGRLANLPHLSPVTSLCPSTSV